MTRERPVLLPYQRRWIEDPAPLKLCEKSRRIGLSWAEAADAALICATARDAGGDDYSYIGTNREMARGFIDDCGMFARAFEQAASEVREEVLADGDRDILAYRIDFSSGFHCLALSSKPSNLRSRRGTVCIDEAAFHEDLSEVVKAATPLLMWGGRVRVISTHNGEDSEFNELASDARAGRKDWSVHRITLDGACAEGLYRRICETRGIDWSQQAEQAWKGSLRASSMSREDAAEEYDCVPKRGGGAYLPLALIESCMREAPVLRFEGSARFNDMPERFREAEMREWIERELDPLLGMLDPRRGHCLGEDFGRTADLTVLAPLEVGSGLQRRVPFLCELRNVPFRQQEQVLRRLGDGLPRFRAAKLDARGNGQYLAERARDFWGGRVEAVMLTQAWYLENMPPFKAAFEDGLIEIPRDDEVASDLRALQVIKGIPKLPDGKTAEGRHGDAAIALCMAHAASRADTPRCDGYAGLPRHGTERFRRLLDPDGDGDWRRVKATGGFYRGCM